MMRWNSTKTYTEEDMIRMQQEAINRVHEFQARSQAATQQFIDVPPSAMQPVTEEPEPILFDPTPEISFSQGQAMGGPAQVTEGGVIEAESHVVPQQPAQQKSQQCAQRIRKKAAAEIGEWRVVPQAQRQVIIRGNPQIGGLVQRNAK